MSNVRTASICAYTAAALFAALFVSFSVVPERLPYIEILAVLGIASHALLLPIIATLPAPRWARVGGYAWALGDIILNTASLNATTLPDTFGAFAMAIRYGLHVCAGIWLIAAAMANTGALRWATAIMGIALAGFSLVAPYVPPEALYPVMIVVVLWLALVGWALPRAARNARATNDSDAAIG